MVKPSNELGKLPAIPKVFYGREAKRSLCSNFFTLFMYDFYLSLFYVTYLCWIIYVAFFMLDYFYCITLCIFLFLFVNTLCNNRKNRKGDKEVRYFLCNALTYVKFLWLAFYLNLSLYFSPFWFICVSTVFSGIAFHLTLNLK